MYFRARCDGTYLQSQYVGGWGSRIVRLGHSEAVPENKHKVEIITTFGRLNLLVRGEKTSVASRPIMESYHWKQLPTEIPTAFYVYYMLVILFLSCPVIRLYEAM